MLTRSNVHRNRISMTGSYLPQGLPVYSVDSELSARYRSGYPNRIPVKDARYSSSELKKVPIYDLYPYQYMVKQKKRNWKMAFLESLFSLRNLVLLVSLCGFLYQSFKITWKFYNQPPMVDVKLETNDQVLPSITLCAPEHIKPSVLISHFNITSNELTDRLKQVDATFYYDNKTKLAKKREITRSYFERTYLRQHIMNLSVYLNMSIPEEEFVIECTLIGCNETDLDTEEISSIDCGMITPVQITLVEETKCFTYFSLFNTDQTELNLKKTTSNDFIKTREIVNIKLNFLLDEEYGVSSGEGRLYMHSSRGVLSKSNYYVLKPGLRYDVFFSKTGTHLLPSPHRDNCLKYQRENPTEPQSSLDCVNRCLIERVKTHCECVSYIPFIRVETVNHSERVCPASQTSFMRQCTKFGREKSEECKLNCKPDCDDVSYEFSVVQGELYTNEEIENNAQDKRATLQKEKLKNAEIKIIRKTQGDIVYYHREQIILEEFVSYIGSLAGFYLGISVLNLYDELKNIAKKLLRLIKNKVRDQTK